MPARSRTSSASPTKAGAKPVKNNVTPGRRAAPPGEEVSPALARATRKGGGACAAGGRRTRAKEAEQADGDRDHEAGGHGEGAPGDEGEDGEEEEVEAALDSDHLDGSPDEYQANGAKRRRESAGGAKAQAGPRKTKRRRVQDKC